MQLSLDHKQLTHQTQISLSTFPSPLGEILILTNSKALLYLSFTDNIQDFQSKLESHFECIDSPVQPLIQSELKQYFEGKLKKFNTPLYLEGSLFQNTIWQSLLHIPYGKTISYTEQASKVGNPKATRAVAKANSTNPIPIVIPCHRVINHNGSLGGYAGGTDRKEWLLHHEKKHL